MNTVIILVHVAAMICSVILMSGALIMGLFGKQLAVLASTIGIAMTVIGSVAGFVLLVDNPLSLKCALLTAYLASSIFLYNFGFGRGRVEYARFVRSRRSSI